MVNFSLKLHAFYRFPATLSATPSSRKQLEFMQVRGFKIDIAWRGASFALFDFACSPNGLPPATPRARRTSSRVRPLHSSLPDTFLLP
jgi:hypothetical protein